MISQYNAHQPDFGQKIGDINEEWINPAEFMDTEQRKPFKIKSNKTRIYRGVASGQHSAVNNRTKLEEDRRQMLQYNLGGNTTEVNTNSRQEEQKVAVVRPPRVTSKSKKLRHQPKSLRSNNLNNSGMRDGSFISANNQNHTSYNPPKRRNNGVKAPCPVRIPKAVTDGIQFLRSVRMIAEGSTNNTSNIGPQAEESKSPNAYISQNQVSLILIYFRILICLLQEQDLVQASESRKRHARR